MNVRTKLGRSAAALGLMLALLASGAGAVYAAGPPPTYIIVFNDDAHVPGTAPDVAQAYGLEVSFVYEYALNGMAARVPAGRLNALQNDPRVAYVIEDSEVAVDGQMIPNGIKRVFANANPAIGIDGIDDLRVDVDIAIIDTGVDFEHPDLNVVGGVNCTAGNPISPNCQSGGDDDHYHGTHVAGTAAALDNDFGVVGVAPGARIWAVKVLDSNGQGYTSWVIAGIDWVAANADTIEVANMSLGGAGYSQAQYDAIQGAVNNGVAFAVAAGNSGDDASLYSPAAFDNVLTVSAMVDFDGRPGGTTNSICYPGQQDDTLATFSNWGSAVQIAAPGACVRSTVPVEQGSYNYLSGTSMASPHAAGALALLASGDNPNNAADVNALYAQAINAGNFNWTDTSGDGIQEPLLDVSDSGLFAPTLIAPGDGGSGGGTPADLTIDVNAYKKKGNKYADLTWSGATSAHVDVYRDGGLVATTANDGAFTDGPLGKGGGGASFQVCETGTTTCSAVVNVSW